MKGIEILDKRKAKGLGGDRKSDKIRGDNTSNSGRTRKKTKETLGISDHKVKDARTVLN